MTSQADERRTSISRADDGGHRWSPLATHMGYTRTPEQREAILAAIRRMTWIAIRPPHASPLMHIGPAARTLAAAITHGAPLRSAAIASLQPGHTLIGLTDVTGARHYLIDLRHRGHPRPYRTRRRTRRNARPSATPSPPVAGNARSVGPDSRSLGVDSRGAQPGRCHGPPAQEPHHAMNTNHGSTRQRPSRRTDFRSPTS